MPEIPPPTVIVSRGGGWIQTPAGHERTSRTVARSTGDAPTGEVTVDRAFDHATEVGRWFAQELGRNSWDGAGAPLEVHVLPDMRQLWKNGTIAEELFPPTAMASWSGTAAEFSGGIGGTAGAVERPEWASPSGSLDLVAHEFVHGLIDTVLGAGRRDSEQLELRESIADVLAATVDRRNWTIGEDTFTPDVPGDAGRDLANPRFATVDELEQADEAETRADIYERSSPLSYAAVLAAEELGPSGRDVIRDVWYRALTELAAPQHGRQAWAADTTQAAVQLYGADSPEAAAIADAWTAVGLVPHTEDRGIS